MRSIHCRFAYLNLIFNSSFIVYYFFCFSKKSNQKKEPPSQSLRGLGEACLRAASRLRSSLFNSMRGDSCSTVSHSSAFSSGSGLSVTICLIKAGIKGASIGSAGGCRFGVVYIFIAASAALCLIRASFRLKRSETEKPPEYSADTFSSLPSAALPSITLPDPRWKPACC